MKIDIQKIAEPLNEKIKDYACPVCGKKEWIFSDKLFQLIEFYEDKIMLGGPTYIVLPVVCTECGYTFFINPMVYYLETNQDR